jgi:soluble lytic murein transglycosylase-like protein
MRRCVSIFLMTFASRGAIASLILILNVAAFGQKSAVDSAPLSQQERAEAAMQSSLAAQQAAVEAASAKGEPESLKAQSESIERQAASIEGREKLAPPAAGQPNASQPDTTIAKTFYSLPWPDSAPLAVPNVQMVDDCQRMPQDEINKLIDTAARKQGVEAGLLKSVMRQESGFKPCAVSTAGAMGLMQIMPDTADMLGLDDPFDPAKNTEAGARFLKMMLDRYKGDVPMALGAYNAGPERVDKAGGVPPIGETMQYVTNILRTLSLVY